MFGFLRSCISVVSKRALLLMVLNWMFFGGIIAGALLEQIGYSQIYSLLFMENSRALEVGDAISVAVSIFIFNLVLSCFILITLTGLVLFVLPLGFLLFRGLLWGMLLNTLPNPLFLAVFPTLVLEGEAYTLAGVAGIDLGLSWLAPKMIYKAEDLQRLDNLKRAWKDCASIYVLVTLLLLASAVVETTTLMLF